MLARRRGVVERGDDRIDGGALLAEEIGRRRGGGGANPSVARAAPDGRAAGDDQAALLEPAQDRPVGADRGLELGRRHLLRPQRLERGPLPRAEPLPGRQRLLAGGGDLGPQLGPCPHPRRSGPIPGGSTSCRPRDGVEQYSRATQSPSWTSSAWPPPRAPRAAPRAAPAAARSARRDRRPPPAPGAARTGRGRCCRRRPPPSPPAAGSRTGPAASGRSSAARPWQSTSPSRYGGSRTPSAADIFSSWRSSSTPASS